MPEVVHGVCLTSFRDKKNYVCIAVGKHPTSHENFPYCIAHIILNNTPICLVINVESCLGGDIILTRKSTFDNDDEKYYANLRIRV